MVMISEDSKRMSSKEMFDRIVNRLIQEPLLSDFKYMKSMNSFKLNVADGWYKISISHNYTPGWQLRALDGSKITTDFLEITPCASRRFNILWEWFEEFANCEKSILRYRGSVTVRGRDYGVPEEFYFSLDGSNFDKEYHRLWLMIEGLMDAIFDYHTLLALYNHKVKKYLTEGVPQAYYFISLAFVDLMLCRIVAPEDYPAMKKVIYEYLQLLKTQENPNYEYFEPKIPEIIAKLERVGDEYRAKYKPSPEIDHDPIWDTIQARLNSQSDH